MGEAMIRTPTVEAGSLDRDRRKGRGRGALICTFFGSIMMFWAVAFSGKPTPARFAIVGILASALLFWSVWRVWIDWRIEWSAASLAYWKTVRRLYWIDAGVEWGFCIIASIYLAHAHRPDLTPQVLGVIIGLHFLPLVKVFRAPIYYWTGSVMAAASLGSLLIPRGFDRNIAGCSAVGLTLWITTLFSLTRSEEPQV